jgi:DUF971 family protein
MHPVTVHHHTDDHRLDIEWSDGRVSSYDLAYLRGFCPCAGCQGHFSGRVTYVTGASASLVDLQAVGSYAIRPVWSDGHSTGIYAFEYLRRIEHEPPGEGPANRCARPQPSTP